jgi:hypothetical protein
VDTDAKKMERFRDGLDGDLYERLILLEPNSYHELVNKAISQEDAMKKAQEDRKRQADFTSGSESQAVLPCQEAYSRVFAIFAIWAVENDLIPEQAFKKFPVPKESTASAKA